MKRSNEGVQPNVRNAPTRCPFCHEPCSSEEKNVVCNGCLARHHLACWKEAGARCASCASRVGARAEATRAAVPPSSTELLPPDVRARLERALEKGERVVRVAQPRPSQYVASSFPIAAMGGCTILTGLFPGIGMLGLVEGAGPPTESWGRILGLVGIMTLFVGAGILMLFTPVWFKKGAANVCLALTDRRVLFWEPGPYLVDVARGKVVMKTFRAEQLQDMKRTEFPDGSGNLRLASHPTDDGDDGRAFDTVFGLDHVREVEEAIRRTLLEKPGPSRAR